MKPKIIAAIAAAIVIISFISCGWFGSKNAKPKDFDISGEWSIDSIENQSHDSSKNIAMLVVAMASQDSIRLRFNNDSTFSYVNDKEKEGGRYHLSAEKDSLFMQQDSVIHGFRFIDRADSIVSFISQDSLVYHLRKY